MTQKAKSSIFIVIISAVLLAIIGCSTGETQTEERISEKPLAQKEEVKDPDPTPSPTPTPVIDMEEGSYAISEMPLFAIEGTDFVPFSYKTELISSVKVEEEDTGADAEGEEDPDKKDTEKKDSGKKDSEKKDSEEEGEETEEVDTAKYYNTYKVTLKSGLKFADGSSVTADDVLFNIKAHAARDYSGEYSLGELDIPGMSEFHSQVPDEERKRVETIIAAGGFDAEEEKYPEIEGIDPKEQDDVWGCYDEAGAIFAQNIIDYVNSHYALNAYVNAFMSGYLTYAKVEADENLKTAFAYIVWGYGKKSNPYNYRKNTLTTVSGKVWDLNEDTIGAMELWEEIKEYYKGDLSEDGIDNDAAPGTETIEELMAQAYYSKQDYSIPEISSIFKGTTVEDGTDAERECIYFTISSEEDLGSFNFFLTDPKEYERTGELNDPEVIIEVEDEESEDEESEDGEQGTEE